MSLVGILSRRRKLLMFGAFLVVGVAAASALVLPGGGTERANAQIAGCDSDIFGLLCLRKDAPSRTPFTFDLVRDDLPRISVEEFPCINPTDHETEFSEVLRGGDEVAIEFGCGIIVRERQEPGWDLVDIVCDYEDEYYDVRPEPDGIMILIDRSMQDSVNTGGRNDIECTFINREERPNLGAGLGGLFAGQPTPLPTARPAAVAPAATAPSISPPRTGDAGLK